MPTARYPSLNGLRALSIVMVIFYHLSLKFEIFKSLNNIKLIKPFLSLISDGQIGVNIFFVISGFLITSLMLREEKETDTISLKKFYVRRALRIFPAYYFVLLVYFILQLSGCIYIKPSSWVTAMTYTKYFNWQQDWYTAHFWSLSIEEQFYLFWPFVFIGGKKTRIVCSYVLIILVPLIKWRCSVYPISWINNLTIFYRIDTIAFGCLCSIYKNGIIKILSNHWNSYFYCALCALLLLETDFAQTSISQYGGILSGFLFAMCGTIQNISVAIVILYSVFGPNNLWHKILNLKVVAFIGILSYSIYLWQQIFIMNDTTWIVNKMPLNILCIILAALASHYLIEKPFLRLKSKFK